MGKKVDGALLKEESPHNKLMLVWAIHHGRAKTPVIIHENLMNFNREYLTEKLSHFGYKYVCTIETSPAHCGIEANSRSRGYLLQHLADIFPTLQIEETEFFSRIL